MRLPAFAALPAPAASIGAAPRHENEHRAPTRPRHARCNIPRIHQPALTTRRLSMKKLSLPVALAALLAAPAARATPTTTVWAPSTTAVQGYLVPHLSYDTYFGRGASPPAAGAPTYPITTGVAMGVLPSEALQLELGFDLLLPSNDPFLFNAKLGTVEDKLFKWQPSLAVGVFGVGTKSDVTNYDIVYAQAQHSLPWGGFLSVGGYYGAGSEALFTGSNGIERAGFMGGIAAPDIVLDLSWLKKVTLAADIQTGKNVFGAVGTAASFYFTDTIGVLTGPIFFLDRATQPGAASWMWTVQLDVDLPLRAAAPAAPPTAPTSPAAGSGSTKS
jgi:hypothetical protein